MKTDILLVHYQDLALTSRLLDFDMSHQLETKTVAEFYSGELSPDKKYEQITFFTHGTYLGREEDEEPTNRSVHQSLLDEDSDGQVVAQTLSLLEKGAKNTDKIFIESCFCGAVLKDLKDEESLSNVEIVVSSGSKHQSISHKLHFGLEKEFLKNGTDNLFEYATINFPGTIGIKNKNGDIFKLSSIKAEQNDSGEIILKRHLSSPNPEDSGKWWIRDKSITINPADLTQNVKDVALVEEVIKNHEGKARLWQQLGANVNSKVLEDPITLLLAATRSGYCKSIELLLKMNVIETPIEQSLSENIILNAAISHDKDPVLKLLISKLPPEHITESCRVLEKVSKEFSGRLDHKIRRIAESLLPYAIEANNDNAATILLNTVTKE